VSGPAFRLSERRVDDRTDEIAIEGELDMAVAEQLDKALDRAAEWILIDLSGCNFIDSSGIAVILRANIAALARGGRILVHSAQAQVRRILGITGLIDIELVFGTREQALAARRPTAD
jgi:anti-anti-sigma factor